MFQINSPVYSTVSSARQQRKLQRSALRYRWSESPKKASNAENVSISQHHVHGFVTKWKHFPCYWPFVRGIPRSPVNSPYKCQSHGALMFSLIFAWTNAWVHNREVGDLRRNCGHHDVIVVVSSILFTEAPSLWYSYPIDSGGRCTHAIHICAW